MKKALFIILSLSILMVACAGNFGKIRQMPSDEAQALTNNLESAWESYDIRFIPNHALLLRPREGGNSLLVGNEWVMVANRQTWLDLVRRNTDGSGNSRTWFPMTGFRKIEDPSGNLVGFITHARQDLVSARVEEGQGMRLYYSITQTSGP